MKRNFLWSIPGLAVALWLAGTALSASAQSVDASTDAAAGTAADAGAAATTTDSAAGAAGSADASAPATGTTTGAADASTATDASAATSADAATADTPGAQPGTQSAASGEAATSADAQTTTPPAPAQPGASAGISADAGASTSADAAAQPENQQPAPSTDAAAATDAGVDASIQGDANLRAGAQVGAQQNLSLQQGLQFGRATDRGLAINTIARDHFFFRSGLRPGDVLVSFAGRPIRSQADFNRWVFFQPGLRVPVVVLRDGRPQTIYVVHQQQPGVEYQAGYAPAPGGAYLGVTFDAQTLQQAIVRTVSPGSPAERAGIRPGDVIFAVNGNQVGGSQDVIRIVSSMRPGQPIDVAISRQVVLGSRPAVAQAGYSPDVRIQDSVAPQPVPAVPTVPAPAVVGSATVDADAAVVPGSGRFDNTPARAGDVDRDGRLLDADGRVGPVEGGAILPRRRN